LHARVSLLRKCGPLNGAPLFLCTARSGLLLLALLTPVSATLPVRVLSLEANGSQLAEVVIGDYFFSPRSLNVSTGMRVVWNYSGPGSALHTATSENQTGSGTPVFASPNLSPGYTYSLVFSVPGVYRYFCAFHPTIMRDVWVNVTGPPLSSGGTWDGMLMLVAGGIGVAVLVAVVTVFLVRRRRSSHGPAEAGTRA
jgi:plastocyanin